MKKGTIIYGNDEHEKSVRAILVSDQHGASPYYIHEKKVFGWTMLRNAPDDLDVVIVDPVTNEKNARACFAMGAVGALWFEKQEGSAEYIEPYFIFVLDTDLSDMEFIHEYFGHRVECEYELIEVNS